MYPRRGSKRWVGLELHGSQTLPRNKYQGWDNISRQGVLSWSGFPDLWWYLSITRTMICPWLIQGKVEIWAQGQVTVFPQMWDYGCFQKDHWRMLSWAVHGLWLERLRKTSLALTFPASGSLFVLWPCTVHVYHVWSCMFCIRPWRQYVLCPWRWCHMNGWWGGSMGKELKHSGDWTYDTWLHCYPLWTWVL